MRNMQTHVIYGECKGNALAAQERYNQKFPNRIVPNQARRQGVGQAPPPPSLLP